MNLCNNYPSNMPDTGCEEPILRKSPFTVAHNGIDHAIVTNLKGEDVTEYFNITFHKNGPVQVDWKKAPSFDEWRKIAGKI